MCPAPTNSPTSNYDLSKLIVAEARKWLDVPWRHQGRDRRGIDCAGLIVNVGKSLGLLHYDTIDYARWPNSDRLVQLCEENGDHIPVAQVLAGDVVLMKFRGDPTHLGILGDYEPVPGQLSLIHSYNIAGKVVEHVLDAKWRKRLVAAYAYKRFA